MQELAIEVKNLSKSFKISRKGLGRFTPLSNNRFMALNDISFSVKKGEVLGIIGPNGSGKTTLLRTICGVYKPDSGTVILHGHLSPLLQIGSGFQSEFSAKDNIILNGMLLGFPKSIIENKVDSIIKYAELEEFTNLKIKHYSSGMRSRLAFSISMQMNPDILLVDEIFSVGDREFKKKSFETFSLFKKENKTILMATHSLRNLSFCDKALLINKGKIFAFGTPDEVTKKYDDLIASKTNNTKK
jgi:ABC-type polysaccharide/polyol phosphate transport system ATPase subunit